MFIIKLLGKLVKALSSGETPSQLAGGFILGMIIGLTPFWNLHNLVVLVLIVLIPVNLSMAIFSALLFSAFAYLLDPLFHSFGYWLLVDVSALRSLWQAMSLVPIIALSNFNNTVVLGSFIFSIILSVPMYLACKAGVIVYRERLQERIQKLKIVQVIKKSWVYSLYNKINRYWE